MKGSWLLLLLLVVLHLVSATTFYPVGLRANLESSMIDHCEVILLLDGSHSISEDNFQTEKQAAEQLILSTSKQQASLRFAVGLFSDSCTLGSFGTASTALTQINALQQPQSSTNIASALRAAHDLIKQSDPTTKKIVILITDGMETMGGDPEPFAVNLKKEGVELFCIGVSPQVRMEKLKKLATFGLGFYVDYFKKLLETFSAEAGYGDVMSKYEVTVQPSLPKGLFIDQDFKVQLKISNIGINEIPVGSIVRFKQGTHTSQSVINIKQSIAPSTAITVEGTILVKGKPTIQDLDEVLEFDIFLPNGRDKVVCKNNRIELSTEYFLGPFLQWKPFGGVDYLNLLEFGVMGAGKSSFINTVDTCLSSTIQDTVVVGGSQNHVTISLQKVEFSPRVGIRFNIWDTWGVHGGNYEGNNMLNYFLDGLIPENFLMEKAFDPKFVAETIKNNSDAADRRRIHAVLVFVKVDTDQNAEDVKLIQKYIGNCTAKGHNVLLVVTGVHVIPKALHNTKMTEMSQTFGIPKSRAVLVETYFEEMKKSFVKDKAALYILERSLNIGNNYLEEHPELTKKFTPSYALFLIAGTTILAAVLAVALGYQNKPNPRRTINHPVNNNNDNNSTDNNNDISTKEQTEVTPLPAYLQQQKTEDINNNQDNCEVDEKSKLVSKYAENDPLKANKGDKDSQGDSKATYDDDESDDDEGEEEEEEVDEEEVGEKEEGEQEHEVGESDLNLVQDEAQAGIELEPGNGELGSSSLSSSSVSNSNTSATTNSSDVSENWEYVQDKSLKED